MKTNILYSALTFLILTLSSCDLAIGIFKGGFYAGIIVVVIVIAVVIWLLKRSR